MSIPVVNIRYLARSNKSTYQGGDCSIEGKDDGEDFRRLQSAMDILHFSPEDQSSVFRVLSSILHLGNVFFHKLEVLHTYTPLPSLIKCICFYLQLFPNI